MAPSRNHAASIGAHGARIALLERHDPHSNARMRSIFEARCSGVHMILKSLQMWSKWLPKRFKLLLQALIAPEIPWNIINIKQLWNGHWHIKNAWEVHEIYLWKSVYLDAYQSRSIICWNGLRHKLYWWMMHGTWLNLVINYFLGLAHQGQSLVIEEHIIVLPSLNGAWRDIGLHTKSPFLTTPKQVVKLN